MRRNKHKTANHKMRKTASNTFVVRNLHTNVDYDCDFSMNIDEIIDIASENGQHDYEVIDIDCDVNYYDQYMDYNDLTLIQEILYDGNIDTEAINAYLSTHPGDDLQEAYNAVSQNQYYFYPGESDEEVGHSIVEGNGGIELLDNETLQSYFNYDSYGYNEIINRNLDYYDGGYWEFF